MVYNNTKIHLVVTMALTAIQNEIPTFAKKNMVLVHKVRRVASGKVHIVLPPNVVMIIRLPKLIQGGLKWGAERHPHGPSTK